MNEIMRDITAIATAIIGVAVIAVLVQSRNTADVIQAAAGGFSTALGTAMGRGGSGYN